MELDSAQPGQSLPQKVLQIHLESYHHITLSHQKRKEMSADSLVDKQLGVNYL